MSRLFALAALLAPALALAQARGVVGSKHDLSASGPGPIRATQEKQVCIFCHVPHGGGRLGQNRPETGAAYQPYRSTSMASRVPPSPTGATRICLSCHDGTIALGETRTRHIQMNAAAPGGRMPPGPSNVGTDLRLMHPVSFSPRMTAKVHSPPRGDAVKLDKDGAVQCTSCHDPHREYADATQGKFLVKSNRNSAICTACHDASSYAGAQSSHARSTATPRTQIYAERSLEPLTTVANASCGACHQSHGADPRGRLLKSNASGRDDQTCLDCHDGQVARLDVAAQLSKPWAHAMPAGAPSDHDPAEGPQSVRRLPESSPSARRHVTCADCHNAHASSSTPAQAPLAGGSLAGVWGIDRNGQRVDQVQYQYEVCFKCHGDSANQPQARGPTPPDTLRRAVTDTNLRQAFAASAVSFHPVVGPGRNPDVPSLTKPLTISSVVYCTDCHASDEASSSSPNVPRGPHGSSFPHLLERGYSTRDHTTESQGAYALCYKCHDRDVLLSDRSAFNLHRRHVVDQSSPCSSCHNSHGVSAAAGNPANNAHLIDFDVSIVKPGKLGPASYTNRGFRSGSCTLVCHDFQHDDLPYTPMATQAVKPRLRLMRH